MKVATKPENAPNYQDLPQRIWGVHSGIENHTIKPMFTQWYHYLNCHIFMHSLCWLKASLLEAGMTLLDKHGTPNITVISQTKLAHTDTVYNFEVQDFHTYHISEYGVWVHNDQCCTAIQFEHSIHNLPPGERVATIKTEVNKIAGDLKITKDSKLSKKIIVIFICHCRKTTDFRRWI